MGAGWQDEDSNRVARNEIEWGELVKYPKCLFLLSYLRAMDVVLTN